MSYFLGIDLGTTRTSAAVAYPGRPGEVVDLGDRSSAIPSVLYTGADGSVLVGDAAERRAITEPARVVREFKRRVGDPTPLVVSGVPWSPQELSARVVRWVVDRVREREGGPAARIAVTHPASWGPLKRELLGGALAGQGLQVSFLAEPQAAALHYASAERLGPGSTVAVYDLGGGTFDAAVVHKEPHGFSLVGRPEGIERLGGVDFDQAVFDHVRAGMPDAFAALDDGDPAVLAAVAAVRRECSEAKEALSSDTEVTIPVLLPGAQGSVRLHRTEFEAMIRPQIEDTVAALRRAVVSAGLTAESLTAVLLVGGSSRIPLVAQLVSEQLGRPVAVDADPKNAIALGAALSIAPAPAPTGTGAHVPAPRSGGPGPRPVPSGAPPWATGATTAVGAAGFAGMPPSPTGGGPRTVAHGFGGPAPAGGTFGAMPPGAVPPPRPPQGQERPFAERNRRDDRFDDDYPDHPRRRTPALMVSAGGLAASLAVVSALFLIPPQQATTPTADSQSVTDPPIPVIGPPPVDSEALTTTPEPEPTTEEEPDPVAPPTTRRPPRTTTTPPPTTTTEPPVTTTTEPPVTTTTEPPVTTTDPPPPDPAAGGGAVAPPA